MIERLHHPVNQLQFPFHSSDMPPNITYRPHVPAGHAPRQAFGVLGQDGRQLGAFLLQLGPEVEGLRSIGHSLHLLGHRLKLADDGPFHLAFRV
jgi:hypothetical protein